MKKLILNWLFGTDNVKRYMEVLDEGVDRCQRYEDEIVDHLKTLNEVKVHINTILKLIKICENHGIDVDEELKKIDNIKE